MGKVYLGLSLHTDKQYDNKSFYNQFLEQLRELHEGIFFPERFGYGEPARYKLKDYGISGIVKKWSEGNCGIYLETLGKKKITYDISPSRKAHYPRKYPDRLRIHFSKYFIENAHEKILDLVKLLHNLFDSYYISVADFEDLDKKHYFKFKIKWGVASQYEGRDPEEKIPGIYWLNVVGPKYVMKIGKSKFDKIPDKYKEELDDGGFIVKPYNSPQDYNTAEGTKAEEEIKQCFGKEIIFDRSLVDIEELRKKAVEL